MTDVRLGQAQSKNNQKNTGEMSEEELLAMRVNLLNQQEMQKLKSNVELMKLLKDLQESIKTANKEIRQTAQEVKTYPAEAVTKVARAVDAALQDAHKAAQKAQNTYDEAQQLIIHFEKNILYWFFMVGVISPLVLAVGYRYLERWW